MRQRAKTLIFCVLVCFAGSLSAKTYRCTDETNSVDFKKIENGNIYYRQVNSGMSFTHWRWLEVCAGGDMTCKIQPDDSYKLVVADEDGVYTKVFNARTGAFKAAKKRANGELVYEHSGVCTVAPREPQMTKFEGDYPPPPVKKREVLYFDSHCPRRASIRFRDPTDLNPLKFMVDAWEAAAGDPKKGSSNFIHLPGMSSGAFWWEEDKPLYFNVEFDSANWIPAGKIVYREKRGGRERLFYAAKPIRQANGRLELHVECK